ncbi:hypothetical protein B5K06_25920 [Rhizobium grahamii]|uniref:Two-component sensor histidine kinase n=1 Tax=Rhizobium grahamii TaxID=1120045 RepID=A0A370KJ61_9HYPH|nr:hypothetical protein B5K06_25920 [Rhizobium grahamii]
MSAAALLVIFLVAIIMTGVALIRGLQRDTAIAHHKATHDALSGLLNRTGLLEVIGTSPPRSVAALLLE